MTLSTNFKIKDAKESPPITIYFLLQETHITSKYIYHLRVKGCKGYSRKMKLISKQVHLF